MELSFLLMEQIFAMVLIMAVGFIFVRMKLLREEDGKALSTIILYAACPCTIIASFQMDYTPERGQGIFIGIIGAVIVHLVFIVLSNIAEKVFGLGKIEKSSLSATNAGYILLPLVSATLGSEYVFYCSAFIAVQTVFFWTYLFGDLRGEKDISVRKILLNPNIIAIILGFILFFGRFTLPVVLSSAVQNLGNATGALSMLVIGMAVGRADLKEIFAYRRAYFICFGRLIVYPAIIILLILISGICAGNPAARKVLMCTMLASAAPVAAAVTQCAELYGLDAKGAGMINVMSVLLCIASMPFMLWLYQILL